MTENNRLDCAMSAFNALSQFGTDLERLFAAMASLDGIPLTRASDHVRQAIEDLGLHYNAICKNYPPDAFHPDRVSFNATERIGHASTGRTNAAERKVSMWKWQKVQAVLFAKIGNVNSD